MSNKLFKYEIIGFIFVSAFGTINHFLFDLFNSNIIIGLFCPVNESVWEHLKLLYFPYLTWSIVEYFWLKNYKNFFISKLKGVISGMTFIVVFFYTYSGITGKTNTFIDIISFFIGVAIAFIISYEFMRNSKKATKFSECFSIAVFAIITGLFFLFTVAPPLIPLFEDPQNSTYGIMLH